jgi:Zn-dependent protease with chaperone function
MIDRVHPRERLYFVIVAAVSVLVYLLLIFSLIGLVYILIGAMVGLFLNGLFTGHFRGNAVRVSDRQFPDVHAAVVRLAGEVGIEVPAVYVLQAGGVLNAFALRFLGRNYVVLYSDVVELARQQGQQALAFVIAHELAHHQRGHTGWKRLLVIPSAWVPFLGSAYSRACEYTCDAYGADASPEGAIDGLLVLAAGKQLYRDIDAKAYALQAVQEGGFWVGFAELITGHPNLPKRVAAVQARIARRRSVSGATVQEIFAGA